MTQLSKYLREPYPYVYGNKLQLLFILSAITVVSFLFSYVFEPFEINATEHKIPYLWILVLHALLPLPIAFLYFSIVNYFVKDQSKWTLGKEMLILSSVLILIGIGSFLIRDIIYENPENWSFRYLYEEIRNSVFIGVLLLLIALPLNLQRLIYKHNKSLETLKIPTTTASLKQQIIQIASGNENYQFEIQHFLFAKVESNYTEIYIHKENEVQKKLLRITLKELETYLQNASNIYKTHRSYLVNLEKITACVGNAQGYQLSLENYAETVPVSRSKLKEFNEHFSKL
ncbi:MAG: LytTR family transcriptional regulator DNA-binding domain-containing protein [Kordia sp.]|uniref:LytTR family transcriptional regulator DNA-binding domain-containing protein n=1 Tax=Kordia sp. TaxID=1965332 RepID=UPI00385F8E15